MLRLVFILLLPFVFGDASTNCAEEKCKLPDCRCSSGGIPGDIAPKDTPQMVLLAFDDGVTKSQFEYLRRALFNRQNPNGCNITGTFIISHAHNNNYEVIYRLYRQGNEVALHTITHEPGIENWKDAKIEWLEQQYIEGRDILTEFALIPKEAMKGVRSPFLFGVDDNHFSWMKKNNLEWDNSWPNSNFKNAPLWPYTLDYKSKQECNVPLCPKKSFPGLWEVPINPWKDKNDATCWIADSCLNLEDEDAYLDFFKTNFHRHYDSNRAPVSVNFHAYWLEGSVKFNVYNRFLDYLQSLKDVYIVTISQMLQWVKNPTPLSKMKDFWKCWHIPADECKKPIECHLKMPKNGGLKTMWSCAAKCPDVYPWFGNPSGHAQ